MAKDEQKVWRIARFKERCEYRDDQDKKGVLQYTKAFVAAGSDVESRHFMDQLDDLKEEFKNWRQLEGTLNELIRRAANDVCTFRGWLLHQHRPADVARIARWLRCDEKECLNDLHDLETAGFIEQVPLAEFNKVMGIQDFSENPREPGKNPENPQPYKRKRTTGAGKPVNEKETEKETKPQPAQNQNKGQTNLPGTESQINANGNTPANPNAKESNAGQANVKGTAAESSVEPDPVKDPTIPDALGDGSRPQAGIRPPGSDYTGLAAKLDQLHDPECKVFGKEVFKAIFKREPFTEATTSDKHKIQEDNSEVGSFKSAWAMAQNAKLKLSALSALWDDAVAEAEKLGNNRRRKTKIRKLQAVWWRIFKSLLVKARAGELTGEHKRFPP
jgi:hypothetical protein